MLGELELNLEDDSGTHEHGSGKEEKMEATGGSSAYYPKQAVSSEKASESAPATKAGEVKEKEFGGDISSICIAPFEDDQIKGGQFTDFIGDDSV